LELAGGAMLPAMRICLANVIVTQMTQISLATEAQGMTRKNHYPRFFVSFRVIFLLD
jgi:hypothetical protein